MRLVIAGALVARCRADWSGETFFLLSLCVAEGMSAVLLLFGLGTRLGGTAAAVVELWRVYSNPTDALVHVLLATLGGSLALLGPGAYSVDAWIFGWRRIEVPDVRHGTSGSRKVPEPVSKGASNDSN